ncbi:MAG TPA: serine hydrolase domain-containing protein [Parvularculaceae bacterium]|nr:serine hydrolase domain-containing protein [Parvularculaceae bacterium]
MAGASAACAAAPSPDFKTAREIITNAISDGGIPSIAIAVSRHGKIIWEEGFGVADAARHRRATAHTIYPLASVTKSLTSIGVMALAERGAVDIDRPVNLYLGKAKVWSPFWDVGEATVRRVATHTAGLPTYAETCYQDEPDCTVSPDLMIDRYAFVAWRPGDHFDYSNVGYGVMGEVLAHVAGRPYAEALRKTVFKPLGMRDCVTMPNRRIIATYGPDGVASPAREDVQKGASSAACSVHDLVRFGMFSLKDHPAGAKAILSDEAIDRMQNDTVAADGGFRYGMGWWVNADQHGYRVVFGSGGTADRGALLYLVPTEDIAVAVLMNTGDATGVSGKIADEVLAALLPAYGESLHAPQAAPPEETAPENRLTTLAGEWKGTIKTFEGDRNLEFVVDADGSARVSVGESPLVPAPRARLVNDTLLFRSFDAADLGTPDSNRRLHRLGFELHPSGDAYVGAVTVVPLDQGRDGDLLSYPVSLRRADKAP